MTGMSGNKTCYSPAMSLEMNKIAMLNGNRWAHALEVKVVLC